MRYMKYFALLAILMVPFAYSQAQVRVGIGIGVGPAYVAGPPVCTYGYYDYYPYACAPYGYYGPQYFVDGIFIGAGPWYHWGHPAYFWNRGWYRGGDRWYGHRDWDDHRGYAYGHERFEHGDNRGYVHGYGHADGGFRGGQSFRGGQVHGGGGFHGGGRR
jgi:hypothetical protein